MKMGFFVFAMILVAAQSQAQQRAGAVVLDRAEDRGSGYSELKVIRVDYPDVICFVTHEKYTGKSGNVDILGTPGISCVKK